MLAMSVGELAGLRVAAKYSDGSTADVSRSRSTSYISSDPAVAVVTRDGLVKAVGPGTAVICWTGVDKFWGRPDMNRLRPYVPAETALWMVDRKVSLFATDLIGMDNPEEWWEPTHLAWLSNGICMVQQLCNLDKLAGKKFLFIAFPIKAVGGTGCPVRAAALIV